MIHVHPFRAWRPAPHTAHLVGSRSFVQYSPGQLADKLAGNPYTYLHIIHAEQQSAEPSKAGQFDAVRRKFTAFTEKGILQREEHPAFYLYEQSCDAFTSLGVIAAVDVADYHEGRVKVHEQTLAAREELFTEYLEHTGINAEPVLLAVPQQAGLEPALAPLAQGPALYDFATTDRVRHRFWKVDAPADMAALAGLFRDIQAAYIADGHHRCASSALLARHAHAGPGSPKSAFLAYLVPESQLHIYNYDRAVKGLNGLSEAQFAEALRAVGPLKELPDGPGASQQGRVHVLVGSRWMELTLPPAAGSAPVEHLDAARLNQHVLGPILGIHDLRTDPRVRFVPGILGARGCEEALQHGKADVAFHLKAVQFSELKAVADSGACMPPKSTWIEPKLRSGLTIYSLDDH